MPMSAFGSISQSCIEGALLECPRGEWTLDGGPIKTGRDGVRLCLLMDTAIVGEILFGKDAATGFVRVIDQRLSRVEDGFQPAKQLEQGWNRSTAIVCVGVSDDICGQVMTFRSSSMGGYIAVRALFPTYVRFGEKLNPVAYLKTKPGVRGGNPVVDPVFVAENWLPREKFSAVGGGAGSALLLPGAATVAKLEDRAVAHIAKVAGIPPEEVRAAATAVFERPTPAEFLDANGNGDIANDIPF